MRKRAFIRTIYPEEREQGATYRTIDFTSRYTNKYYNIYFGMFDFESDSISRIANLYMKRKLWSDGKFAIWNQKHTDLVGAAQYAASQYDMYDYPAIITLINKHKLPKEVIPEGELIVNKDVVVCFAQANMKPIKTIVQDYADQLSDIDNVMNTNLQLQKLPFIIQCDDEKQARRMRNVLLQILNNDIAVEIPAGDKNSLLVTPTGAPFIVDKLYEYRTNVENELKTYLGLDNSGGYEKKERMITDEVNSQRATITDSSYNFHQMMDMFVLDAKEYLGVEIKVKWNKEEEKNEDTNTRGDQLYVDGSSSHNESGS